MCTNQLSSLLQTLPMPSTLISWLAYPETLLAAAVFLVLSYVLKRRRLHGLPTDWPIFRMLPTVVANFHNVHEYATQVLAATGCTFLLKGPWGASMDILATADPANVNYIFNTNVGNYQKGSDYNEIFDIFGKGIFNADDEEWKIQRKIIHGLVGDQGFRSFVVDTSRRKLENGLIPVVDKAADAGVPIDFQDLFLRFTFDTTCTLVMGVDLQALSPSLPDVPFAHAMDDAEEVIAIRHAIPVPLWKLIRRLNLWHERRLSHARHTIDHFVETHVSKRKQEVSLLLVDGHDILSSFLCAGDRFNCKASLRDTVVNLMLAGRDATAANLTWLFYMLSLHPHVQDKIYEELKQHRRSDDGVLPASEELGNLVYLHAAVLETLRLYPPVPFEHKRAATEDTLPSGHKVTPDVRILVFMYAMARMEGVWGKDCREFRPERWINEKGRLRHEPTYKFMVFNSGPRTCIGKDMAFMQMKTAAAAVVWRYEVELVEGQRVEPVVSILLHMKHGMKVRVRRRKAMQE